MRDSPAPDSHPIRRAAFRIMTALVLAAHGSHISPHTAGVVWACVDQLRAWGVAEEITACFWKEAPSFSQVLHTLTESQVVVVPMFTAQGYFSRTVIPSEMNITQFPEKTIFYTPTLGEHPMLREIVVQRVTDVLTDAALDPQTVTVAIIGHGTRRDPNSRTATRQQAAWLRDSALVADVTDIYLDDDPSIESIYTTARTEILVAVPFFLAMGSHVTQDVPEALGISYGENPSAVNGFQVYYTPPVGTTESLAQVVLELARSSGLPFVPSPSEKVWAGFPNYGRELLLEKMQNAENFTFGELSITRDSVQPIKMTHPARSVHHPAELRTAVRENPFRPLATTRNLPADWCVPVESGDDILPIIETIYPGAVADWAQLFDGKLEMKGLETVCQRQAGMFANLAQGASAEQIETVVQTVCGQCIRHATWYEGATPAGAIPCPEPCNYWLSQLKKVVV